MGSSAPKHRFLADDYHEAMLPSNLKAPPPTSLRVLNGLVHVALVIAVVAPAVWLVTGAGAYYIQAEVVQAPGLQPASALLDAHPAIHGVTAKVAVGETGRVAATALMLILAAFALVFLGQLRGVTQSACAGVPFHVENVTRLRKMGWALIASGLAVWLHAALSSDALRAIDVPGLSLRIQRDFDLSFLVYALVLFALADALSREAGLRRAKALALDASAPG